MSDLVTGIAHQVHFQLGKSEDKFHLKIGEKAFIIEKEVYQLIEGLAKERLALDAVLRAKHIKFNFEAMDSKPIEGSLYNKLLYEDLKDNK